MSLILQNGRFRDGFMTTVRSTNTIWLPRSSRGLARIPRAGRASGAVLARALALAAFGAGIFAFEATALPPPNEARAAAASTAASLKNEARLPLWNGPLAPRVNASTPAPAGVATPDGPALPTTPEVHSEAGDGWREGEFSQVVAVDGRTLEAGGLRIRLEGLALSDPGEVCRTLDGRLEACAVRAATQLELITRWRKVTCRYRPETASEAVGACRIGSSDLAERLVKTGYAHRPGEPRRAVVAQATRLD